jgi:hypothetical protein
MAVVLLALVIASGDGGPGVLGGPAAAGVHP